MNAILHMLKSQGRHISFHTPGHKRPGADITELSYSDTLSSPSGVLKEAEQSLAQMLGAQKSFLLTDGSTCGVFSMLYSVKLAGGKRIAAPVFSHPSVFHACEVMGLELVPISQDCRFGLPLQPEQEEIERKLSRADALLLTSPDYYGYFAPLKSAKELCASEKKPLLVDGAHGGHLHGTPGYAGNFADLWVDGVHKSLPALTQGALVSARGAWAERLSAAVLRFRTTSPSYPIMASVEYAMNYPRNRKIEEAAEAFKNRLGLVKNDDWTKLLVPFGENCKEAERALEARGVYPEFCDGNYLLFYLSPCTKPRQLRLLERLLRRLPRAEVKENAPCGHIPMYGTEKER